MHPEWASRHPLLASLVSPAELKGMDAERLRRLAAELRSLIIETVTHTGGHLGAGLGVVELTLALFAEFDFNEHDKLVWDVGHQCYPHKLLTGRADRFHTLRQWGGLSGFPDPAESPYDTVKTGHGGTSISTAMGFALAWRGAEPDRAAVAVIGDGALQEGSAYEALNHAGSFDDLNLVVVLNDNNSSIGPSVGAVSAYLSRLRQSGRSSAAVFEELGFQYHGPIDGHDVDAVRRAIRATRHVCRPRLVHVVTQKGRGYKDDVPETTGYHAAPPSKAVAANTVPEYPDQGGPSFTSVFADQVLAMAERDPRVVVLTAAMLEGTGLAKVQERLSDRCLDVGMAEQHAVSLAGGLALAGRRPICAVYSTFLQRSYDQVFQEVALQRAPVLFCLDRAGLVGADGATHNGVFDIAYLRCLPNFTLMAPRDTGELVQMMELAATCDGPVAIRFPRGSGVRPEVQPPHRPFGMGEAELLADGEDGCLLTYGPMCFPALEVRRRIAESSGRVLAVINARFAKPLDEGRILAELERQPTVFSIEDHAVAGGFGSAVAEFAQRARPDGSSRLDLIGIPDRFVDHGERAQQLAGSGLDVDTLTERVQRRLERISPAQRPVRLAKR